jgi:uncharacterized protein (TIGR03083 family)
VIETEAGRSGDGETALAILSLVARDLTELFGSVDEVDWDRPTPCAEWTLRDLTEHVTGGNRFTIRILAGDNSEEAMVLATRSPGPLSDRTLRPSLAQQMGAEQLLHNASLQIRFPTNGAITSQ